MEERKDNSKSLNYIDPDLFEPTNGWDQARLVAMYECAICSGIVLKPLECSTPSCAMLYCEKCINALKVRECPRRCGSKAFNNPNKHIMNNLYELKFKCQN